MHDHFKQMCTISYNVIYITISYNTISYDTITLKDIITILFNIIQYYILVLQYHTISYDTISHHMIFYKTRGPWAPMLT